MSALLLTIRSKFFSIAPSRARSTTLLVRLLWPLRISTFTGRSTLDLYQLCPVARRNYHAARAARIGRRDLAVVARGSLADGSVAGPRRRPPDGDEHPARGAAPARTRQPRHFFRVADPRCRSCAASWGRPASGISLSPVQPISTSRATKFLTATSLTRLSSPPRTAPSGCAPREPIRTSSLLPQARRIVSI